MNISQIKAQAENYWKDLKKQSFGNQLMRKKSMSTLERLMIYTSVALLGFIISVFLIITPGMEQLKGIMSQNDMLITKIYGDADSDPGMKFVYERSQQILQEEEAKFAEKTQDVTDRLGNAIWEKEDIYRVATFLEDYAVTLHSDDKPLVISNISFGKSESASISPAELKQAQTEDKKVVLPAEYRFVPVSVSLEAHREKFEQFLEFVYHSGDLYNYYFKGVPVPVMSIESLSIPVNEDVEDEEELIQNYSLKMRIYFQKATVLEEL